jgi:hypothetical protein
MLGRRKNMQVGWLVSASHPSEVEIATEKLKRYKLPHSNQILAELIQVGNETSCPEIHTLINSIWNTTDLPQQWKESVVIPIYNKSNKIYYSNY